MKNAFRLFVSVTDDNWTVAHFETLEEAQTEALDLFVSDGPSKNHPFSDDRWEIVRSVDLDGDDREVEQWMINWRSHDADTGDEIDSKSYCVEWPAGLEA